jgi:hypothetical protein
VTKEQREKLHQFVTRWVVPAGAVIAVLAAFLAVLRYVIKSEVSDIASDVNTLKSEVSTLQGSANTLHGDTVATNKRIDDLLEKALERAFPTPTASKATVRDSLKQTGEVIQFAKSENIRLNPLLLANYGKQVSSLNYDPGVSGEAWKTLSTLLEYRAFLNTALAPSLPDVRKLAAGGMSIVCGPTSPASYFSTGFSGYNSTGHGALFYPLSEDRKTPLPSHVSNVQFIIVDSRDCPITLDDYRLRNVVIRGATIVYNGGPLEMDNVYFINCTFQLKQSKPAQAFANAILNHVPTSFSPS